MTSPGWYPDPSGRFEHRYHDGVRWTADVASSGTRYVDAPASAPTASNGIAVAALTCGLVALAVAWVPVLFVVGAVLAVLAVIFGIIGISRARDRRRGRGLAIAGVATGVAGIGLAVVGAWFTVSVFRAIDRYEQPAAHEIGDVVCEVVDGRVQGSGTIEHLGASSTDFTVSVEIRRRNSEIEIGSSQVRVLDVAPGEERTFRFTRRTEAEAVTCEIVEVRGPLPFGIRLD